MKIAGKKRYAIRLEVGYANSNFRVDAAELLD